jgi:hypothetical protein
VDTQRLCHPDLAVDVEDVEKAAFLAQRLVDEPDFYQECSDIAKTNYKKYYSIDKWKSKINLE